MAASPSFSSLFAAAALLKEGQRQGQRFLDFVNKTGSPYHSVQAVKECLQQGKRQFVELRETEMDKLHPGRAYYLTRNNACIAAFVVGERPHEQKAPAEDRFLIIASHTDSPCLRLRPNCNITSDGTHQVGVECYGGGLWHTWLDRGLGLAGVVYVKEKGQVTGKLLRIPRPLLFIPNLAIHLRSAEELAAGLKLSKEKELQPFLCTEVYEQLLRLSTPPTPSSPRSGSSIAALESKGDAPQKSLGSFAEDTQKREAEEEAAAQLLQPKSTVKKMMPAPLLRLLARELKVEPDAILSWDLCLMDATPGRLCGISEEFVESPRLDNLVSTFAAFDALSSCEVPPYTVAVAMGFDHEEVGSDSYSGANSCLARTWLKLIADGLGIGHFERMLMRSCLLSAVQLMRLGCLPLIGVYDVGSPTTGSLITTTTTTTTTTASIIATTTTTTTTTASVTPQGPPWREMKKELDNATCLVHRHVVRKGFVDMAHALHHNYADRHQAQHKPLLQRGLVVKENANQRYATNAYGTALLRDLAEKHEVPLQDFVVRNDSRCGSTVGPYLSAQLGVCTIDVGVPQWAMHSCREICGVLDLAAAGRLFKAFYGSLP